MRTQESIKVNMVSAGAARTDDRAPSCDSEFVTVVRLGDYTWFATNNRGVITRREGDWFEASEVWPGWDELNEAAAQADEPWDFAVEPDKYGNDARDEVKRWLSGD